MKSCSLSLLAKFVITSLEKKPSYIWSLRDILGNPVNRTKQARAKPLYVLKAPPYALPNQPNQFQKYFKMFWPIRNREFKCSGTGSVCRKRCTGLFFRVIFAMIFPVNILPWVASPGSPRIHLGYIKLFKNNKHRLELAWRTAFCAYLTKCK